MNTGLVISKTPYRISFLGGGTDYPDWFNDNDGAVISTSINKYLYITTRWNSPFFSNKFFISYSKLEAPNKIDEINHPSVRECFRFMNINKGVSLYYIGDLPGRSGMGTSASFTVGTLNSLFCLNNNKVTKLTLARSAIKVDQEMVGEVVGSQDHVAAAFGGFNRIDFNRDSIEVKPINGGYLEPYFMLFFTGFLRNASNIAKDQISRIKENKSILKEMQFLVNVGENIIARKEIVEFGRILHNTWELKKKLSKNISTSYIDFMYERALKAGAIGGKLLGAGSGGFLLLFVEPDRQLNVKNNLSDLLHVPFKFESIGSQIIYDGNN